MKITNVSVYHIENNESANSRLYGYAQVTFDDALKITGLRVYESKNGDGFYVVYPRNPASKHKLSYSFPVDKNLMNAVNNAVTDEIDSQESAN